MHQFKKLNLQISVWSETVSPPGVRWIGCGSEHTLIGLDSGLPTFFQHLMPNLRHFTAKWLQKMQKYSSRVESCTFRSLYSCTALFLHW